MAICSPMAFKSDGGRGISLRSSPVCSTESQRLTVGRNEGKRDQARADCHLSGSHVNCSMRERQVIRQHVELLDPLSGTQETDSRAKVLA